jgi:hypothetical protein
MNVLERTLREELEQLMDRLAGSLPAGSVSTVRSGHPTLSARLDETEARLASLRAALLDGYGRWGRALEDLENLWALATWRSAAEDRSTAEQPAEKTGSLAA